MTLPNIVKLLQILRIYILVLGVVALTTAVLVKVEYVDSESTSVFTIYFSLGIFLAMLAHGVPLHFLDKYDDKSSGLIRLLYREIFSNYLALFRETPRGVLLVTIILCFGGFWLALPIEDITHKEGEPFTYDDAIRAYGFFSFICGMLVVFNSLTIVGTRHKQCHV